MRIAVCVKQVPDTDDVTIDRRTGTLRRNEAPGILNPADRTAVRMAVSLKKEMETLGEKTSLTAITMGPPPASEVLREVMACGADDGILLCDRAFAGGDTWATSLVLAEAVKKAGGFSVIVAGKQTTDGETGHVGPQLAEHLGIAQITSVVQVKWNGTLLAERKFDGFLEMVECEIPAVIVCAGGPEEWNSPSLSSICEAYERQIIRWGSLELGLIESETGLKGSRTAVRRTFIPESISKGIMLKGSVENMAQTLAEELKGRHILT